MGVYEYAAIDMLERFDAYVEGAPDSTLMIVSFEALCDDARKALMASAETLGYGRAGISWVTLSASNESKNAAELCDENLRTLIEGLDPIAIIASDAIAAGMLVNAYDKSAHGSAHEPADDGSADGFAKGPADGGPADGFAQTHTNRMARIAGRNTVLLEDFESALSDEETKQLVWHLMKKLSR